MFSTDVPSYTIDLRAPESQRWAEVILREKTVADRVVREAGAVFDRVPELFRRLFARLYKSSGGLYQDEIIAWADGLGISEGTVTLLNCVYELSHLRFPKVFGCTAGVRWIDGLGMFHLRNLDWPLETMGPATRVFRFRRGEREFVTVGVPGQVAVLSGMLSGAYSVTINWAPPAEFPSFEFGPAFLLRDTLETCDTYDAAVKRLSETRLSASVFYTVCGTEPDQACVIERTPTDSFVRHLVDGLVVQANHHVDRRFSKNNKDLLDVSENEQEFSLVGSRARSDTLSSELSRISTLATLENAIHPLKVATVFNKFTCQQMLFCPRSGEFRVWRRTEQGSIALD